MRKIPCKKFMAFVEFALFFLWNQGWYFEHTGWNFVAGDPVFSVWALADERGAESDASSAVGAGLAGTNVLVALVNVATLKWKKSDHFQSIPNIFRYNT